MKIRLFDRFDTNFTAAIYDDVDCVVNNTIIFIDGDEIEIDSEFYDWEEYEDEEYTPSATHGDYSPSNPWDAPGMSVSDFIDGVSMF